MNRSVGHHLVGIFCTICQAKPCLQAMQDGRAAPGLGVDALVPPWGPWGLERW